jgi:NADPH2:quinone reductase
MRAVQMTEFGGPEVLQLVDLPEPEPAAGEVRIRVTRAGLNFADTHQRHNRYIAKQTLPLVPGSEVAGIREDTGERVVALCGTGGYAEVATAPEALTVPVPEGLDDGTALAMLIQGTTAWHLYRTSANLRPGETVVVQSAAGGTGSLCVQLGKAFGAGRVIATASSEEKRRLALDLGADVAIDSDPEGMAERIIAANEGRKADVILEMAGGKVFEESLAATAPLGRCVVYGIASHEQNDLRTGKLLKGSLSVVGFWFNHVVELRPDLFAEGLQDLYARAAAGEIRVVVGRTYGLSEARQAQEDLAARRTSGKLLLDPAG